MRISDWSSDVCSSDLPRQPFVPAQLRTVDRGLGQPLCRRGRSHAAGGLRAQPQGRAGRAGRAFLLVPLRGEPVAAAGAGALSLPTCCSARLWRSEEHTSELQSLMRLSYAVFCLQKKTIHYITRHFNTINNTYI